jgi:hypothetical protein
MSDQWTGTLLRAACKRAGVEPFTMHDLRRTFATEAVRAGVPLTQVQQWLAHRSIRTTQRYLGRYAGDARVVAPAPAAAAVLAALPADVIPIAAAGGAGAYRPVYRTTVAEGANPSPSGTSGPGAGSAAAAVSSGNLAEEERFELPEGANPRRFSRPLLTGTKRRYRRRTKKPRTVPCTEPGKEPGQHSAVDGRAGSVVAALPSPAPPKGGWL